MTKIVYIPGYLPARYIDTVYKGKNKYYRVCWDNLTYHGRVFPKDFLADKCEIVEPKGAFSKWWDINSPFARYVETGESIEENERWPYKMAEWFVRVFKYIRIIKDRLKNKS